ncbi:TrfB-related DNA-binding protein [Pseudomonas amygdali pv. morsprunorum]|uniref:TrfB-related DNA-binding protein n=1 Tax=Pseudomonas amygdali TaxID=47877 RepID=UPI0028920651|nr:TrfB-related DNA-binding protein [Pseudomonas amygdali]MDT3268711.1 TrfB-related DNA-binding protein [Pseudomonas amygdali pv. morsprunorum]
MAQTRYTPEQWESYSAALRSMSVKTVELARAVLVEGKKPVALADETGDKPQVIYAAVKRVNVVLATAGAQELIPVLVWVPAELEKDVRAIAKPYAQPQQKA